MGQVVGFGLEAVSRYKVDLLSQLSIQVWDFPTVGALHRYRASYWDLILYVRNSTETGP